MKVKTELDQLATNIVGDGKQIHIYIVSINGIAETVTRCKDVAVNRFDSLIRQGQEITLEDRMIGVIASYQKDDDKDSPMFGRWQLYRDY